jgi:beta-1,4-N-acetylglucosaminyltransferase
VETSIKEIWKKSKILGKSNLILVIVGLMYGFERLVKQMDELAGKIEEEVVIQIGNTPYRPKNARFFTFVSKEEINRLYDNARVVVCHAGVGSILTALDHGKPVIAVTRREKYGEHCDDHQLDIAGAMEKEGWISVVYDEKNLEEALKKAISVSEIKLRSKNILVKKLKEYIV